MYLTMQLTGNDILRTANPLRSVRWNMHFELLSVSSAIKKTAYRGLKKNENRLYAMFACANLYVLAIAGRKLSTT